MTTPSIIPTQYVGLTYPWLQAPVDRSGALRMVEGAVSIPATTATDAIIGLVPFQAGARFHIDGASIWSADLDSSTNVTMDIGYVFDQDATYTNDLDAWVSASTAPQAGGFLTPDEKEGLSFVAGSNGWLTAQVNAATTTTGTITFQVAVAYDS